ncbi:IS3 family transposase [Paenibacillus sp. FSL H7-0714]|uniref:IS3 family transposase n=1 Tax=Paenibacillus sp. FSL H7-0714 TaxID=2954735 RepID=UPI0030F5B194
MNRKPSSREDDNEKLTEAMLLLYEKVERIFGYRQLTLHLRRQMNKSINAKRVYRLMNAKASSLSSAERERSM